MIKFIDTTSGDTNEFDTVRAIVRYYPRGEIRPEALTEPCTAGRHYTSQQELADDAHTTYPAQGAHVIYIMDDTSRGQDPDQLDAYTWWPSDLVTDDE
jgi:hypothetical protein